MPTGNATTAGERIIALDVLRGFALYGVFLVNASVSARPLDSALEYPGSEGGLAEIVAWVAVNGFAMMKFVAIFSLLFGAGLILQTSRLEARVGGAKHVYRKRLSLLALAGVLHGCLLFEGDILLLYAIVGALLYALRHRSARWLAVAALVPFAVALLLSVGWSLVDLDALIGEDSGWDMDVLRAHQEGPLSLTLRVRVFEYLGWLVLSTVISFNWRVVAFFLLGAATMKLRLFSKEHAALHRRAAWIGLLSGSAMELTALWITSRAAEPVAAARVASAFLTDVGSVLLSMGYVAVVLRAVHGGWVRGLQRGLACVGRTALTNYIIQSLLLNLLFFWYGLDLYQVLSGAQVIGIVTLLFGAQIIGSWLWLRRFRMGPLEWLWRRASYGAA